ncbi:antibiotic biosynthesis monooxygenase [Flavobacterium cerinum]|nr:antibiotic biosynthesis monooxygenase [Flavobacterium cerinum]
MKTTSNSKLSLGLLFLTLSLYAQSPLKETQPLKTAALKEYVLLFRYPNINYTEQQLADIGNKWHKTIAGWKSKGLYISNEVFEPKGILITGTAAKISENTFAEGTMFLGAIVTVLAQNKEQAVELAKESPVLATGGNIEVREYRYIDKSKRVTFIDTFTIPENAHESFINRMNKNRELLKTIPGFIEDHAYVKTVGESRFNYITIAIWENEEAISNAKKAVEAYYRNENFNLQEFIKQNGIIMERALYSEMEK